MVNLADWNKNNILKFSVDNTYIDEDLLNFPLMLNISLAAGKNDYDCTNFFEELIIPSNVSNFTKYALLLNFENNNIQDKSLYRKTNLTFTGTCALNTSTYKFGTAAYSLLPGYITIPLHNGLVANTQDFTVHGWFYLTTAVTHTSFFSYGAYTAGFIVCWYANTNIRVIINGTSMLDTPLSIPYNTWVHLAVTRYNGYIRFFYNGTQYGSDYLYTNAITPTVSSYVGKDDNYLNGTFNGIVDAFTIIIGEALWSSNFTPPTTEVTPATILNKKIAVVYPSVQEHWVNDTFISYNHGEKEQLYCEIESWDYKNKSIQIWTKVPKVLNNQPTDILVYYDSTQPDNTQYIGNTNETPAQQVWTNGFVAVYHMAQTPIISEAGIFDSTSNMNHGTPASLLNTDLTTGLVGKGIKFDGSNDFILAPSSIPISVTGTLTLDIFAQTSAATGSIRGLIQKGVITTTGLYSMFKDDYQRIRFRLNARTNENYGQLTSTSLLGVSTWYNLTAVYTGNQQHVYINGNLDNTTSYSTAISTDTNGLYIGRSSNYYWDDTIQMVSVSNIVRSAAWVKATNYSQRDELLYIEKATLYKVSGHITAFGNPASRTLYLYDRDSGQLVDKVTSDIDGYFSLYTETNNRHEIICLDDAEGLNLNDKLISKVIPVEIV